MGREEHSLSMSKNRVLRHTFRPKRRNLEEDCKYIIMRSYVLCNLHQGWTRFSKISEPP
jgi:hypothetical protein